MAYRPELDGVRGIAILLVFWHHLGLLDVPRVGAGFLGVDVFFVLSGYLITTLLMDEHRREETIRLGAFYARRALRLLPALVLMLVVAGIVVWASGRDDEIRKYVSSLPWVIAYAANWKPTGLGILTHTWTLAIEEQFYVLWPPALVLLLRRRMRPEWLAYVMIAFAVVLAVIAARWGSVPPQGLSRTGLVVVGTYARAAAIALGCAIALAPRIAAHARDRWVGLAGVVGAVAVLVMRRDPATFHLRVGYIAFALFVAIVIAHVIHAPDGPIASVLRNRALVVVGRVSYGVYLFHVPVVLFIRWEHPVPMGAAAGSIAIVATAALVAWSWFVVERPALRYQERFRTLDRAR